jgi:uncharacterized SAM-binding protein YcdF (DUF218 family)
MKIIKKIIIFFALIFTLSTICVMAIFQAGPWLVAKSKTPDSLDMIFTFGGDIDRYEYSKSLVNKYPEAFWVVSTGNFPVFDTILLSDIVRRNAVMNGFDDSKFMVNDSCTSTGSEINVLKEILKTESRGIILPLDSNAGKYDSLWHMEKQRMSAWFLKHPADTIDLALVSDAYHTRRIKLWAGLQLKDMPVRIHMMPVPKDTSGPNSVNIKRWWKNEKDASLVINEYIKILYYFTLRGRI